MTIQQILIQREYIHPKLLVKEKNEMIYAFDFLVDTKKQLELLITNVNFGIYSFTQRVYVQGELFYIDSSFGENGISIHSSNYIINKDNQAGVKTDLILNSLDFGNVLKKMKSISSRNIQLNCEGFYSKIDAFIHGQFQVDNYLMDMKETEDFYYNYQSIQIPCNILLQKMGDDYLYVVQYDNFFIVTQYKYDKNKTSFKEEKVFHEKGFYTVANNKMEVNNIILLLISEDVTSETRTIQIGSEVIHLCL